MSAGVLIDTDVLIDYLRGQPQAVSYLEDEEATLHVSAITLGELYAGVREGRERSALESFITAFLILSVEPETAIQGGLLCRDYRKSHGVGLADALVAATAMQHELELVTLNQKHYPMLKSVRVPYQKAR
jgi:predicted nucleic acid-binding protein